MSLSDRRVFLTSLLALGACGFEPVYGPDGDANALRGQIAIVDPGDLNGFNLTRQLEDRIGRNGDGPYLLSVSVDITEEALGILADQTTTRYNLTGIARYTVLNRTSEEVITSGQVQNFTSYAATGTIVSTLRAEQDANERLMVILADQIVTRLIASSSDFPA